jgi:N-acetylmuramoyl-L-alanine amidase
MQQNNKITESTAAAEQLLNAGNQRDLPMKRVAQAPFFVLRGAGMPAVLLETGFITNLQEAKLLANPGYQQRIAEAMADGICGYLGQSGVGDG